MINSGIYSFFSLINHFVLNLCDIFGLVIFSMFVYYSEIIEIELEKYWDA
jgi:hypothetical protein